jgi:F420 biosynthesis protein FbiB-like protein
MEMTLHDAMHARQTVRRFRDTPISDLQRDALIEAAALAPSPHGRQPWQFIEIAAGDARQRLVSAMSASWQTQLTLDGNDPDVIATRITASSLRITHAPLLIMPCVDMQVLDHYPDIQRQQAEYVMAVQSIGCAIQHMLLQAVSMGFAGGWMCAPLFCAETVRAVFTLPDTLIPQALIPFGYMAQAPQRRPKRRGVELFRRVT